MSDRKKMAVVFVHRTGVNIIARMISRVVYFMDECMGGQEVHPHMMRWCEPVQFVGDELDVRTHFALAGSELPSKMTELTDTGPHLDPYEVEFIMVSVGVGAPPTLRIKRYWVDRPDED